MSSLYKSFSFKLALMCFAVFLVLLLFFYYTIYTNVVEQSRDNLKEIISAEMKEINTGISGQGADYAQGVVENLVSSDKSGNFAAAYFDSKGRALEGNLDVIPQYENKNGYVYFGNYIGKLQKNEDGSTILLAHSARHIERTEDILDDALASNIVFSLFAAVICSGLVAYVINRKLKSINEACDEIISGDMSARVKAAGDYDQFAMLAGNINRMLEWINNLLESTKNTAISLAHDIKTPLNRHRIRLEKLASNNEEIAEALVELDKINAMFDSVLSISKAEAQVGKNYFEEIALDELINDIVEIYEAVAEDKNIDLEKNIAQNIRIKCHRQFLAQGISNLVDNAIKYTPNGGHVKISAWEQDEGTFISVADSGEGIAPELYGKVTEKFFRLDKSRGSEGVGLGLSLVKAVVKLHEGELVFSSNNPGLVAVIILK